MKHEPKDQMKNSRKRENINEKSPQPQERDPNKDRSRRK